MMMMKTEADTTGMARVHCYASNEEAMATSDDEAESSTTRRITTATNINGDDDDAEGKSGEKKQAENKGIGVILRYCSGGREPSRRHVD